jgi:hypothetical protein
VRARPGSPYPLDATGDGVGLSFARFSEHAARALGRDVKDVTGLAPNGAETTADDVNVGFARAGAVRRLAPALGRPA